MATVDNNNSSDSTTPGSLRSVGQSAKTTPPLNSYYHNSSANTMGNESRQTREHNLGSQQYSHPEDMVSDTSSRKSVSGRQEKKSTENIPKYHTRSQSQSKSQYMEDNRRGMTSAPASPAPTDISARKEPNMFGRKRSSKPDLIREDSLISEYYNNYMEKGSESFTNLTKNLKGLFSGSLSNLSSAAQSLVGSSAGGSIQGGSGYAAEIHPPIGGPGAALSMASATSRRSSGTLSAMTGLPSVFSAVTASTFLASSISKQQRENSASGATPINTNKPPLTYDTCSKTLLVIDERHTDWSKYFRGQKINAEWDIRLEQAEFKDINVASYSDTGTVVDMEIIARGTKVIRSFKPDFVLVRQFVKEIRDDWRNLLIGFMYGNVPSINTFESIYNFYDKPRVFAELVKIQQKLGKEQFPLIEQAYYPNSKEMMITPKFPIVVKIGAFHNGSGKVKIDNHYDFQDITSLIGVTQSYSTIEPFVESKYDIHIQKIGTSIYKAFMRKSISGNWKANMGSSILEEIPVNEKYKLWVDECSNLFGGLDILAVEAIKSKDGREFIIGVNGSAMNLLGESQESDRCLIAQLTLTKMEQTCIAKTLTDSRVRPPADAANVNATVMIPELIPNHVASERSAATTADSQQQSDYAGANGRGRSINYGPPVLPPPPLLGRPMSKQLFQQALQDPTTKDVDRPPTYPARTVSSAVPAEASTRKEISNSATANKPNVGPPSTAAARYPGQSPIRAINPPSGVQQQNVDDPRKNIQSKSSASFYAPQQTNFTADFMKNSSNESPYVVDTRSSQPSLTQPYSSRQTGLNVTPTFDKDNVGDTMGNLRKTFAGIFGDL